MISDFDESDAHDLEADVCIVGSGATGIASAVEFFGTDIRVIVLEGGRQNYDPAAADVHRGIVEGLPHAGIHEARERMVGGTTTKWGGQALPFLKEDFGVRSWVPHSGWPFSRDTLWPFYERASRTLGLDTDVPFDVRPWATSGVTEPEFDAGTLELFVTKWCRQPNFALLHGQAMSESSNVHLVFNASAVALRLASDAKMVREVTIRSLKGRTGRVRAKHIILAGGAIETARLLLASNDVMPAGIGNAYDKVGRYFQDHTASIVGLFLPQDRGRVHDVFDPFYLRKFKYFPRLRLTPQFARAREILHASIQIVFPADPEEAIDASKMLVRAARDRKFNRETQLAAMRVVRRPMDLAKAAWRLTVKKRGIASRGPLPWLECQSEQDPDPESRVRLSETERDEFGMPRVRLQWQVSDLTYKTIREAAAVTANQFGRANLGDVVLDDWAQAPTPDWRSQMGDVFHQCGTTRMSESETAGVVDPSGTVHGVHNLHIASSGVFPTSSFSNPTMTAIAFSIRVCDDVKRRLKSEHA